MKATIPSAFLASSSISSQSIVSVSRVIALMSTVIAAIACSTPYQPSTKKEASTTKPDKTPAKAKAPPPQTSSSATTPAKTPASPPRAPLADAGGGVTTPTSSGGGGGGSTSAACDQCLSTHPQAAAYVACAQGCVTGDRECDDQCFAQHCGQDNAVCFDAFVQCEQECFSDPTAPDPDPAPTPDPEP